MWSSMFVIQFSKTQENVSGVAECPAIEIDMCAGLLFTVVDYHVTVNMLPSEGINVPLFYVHTDSSVNVLHYEDQLVDCVH